LIATLLKERAKNNDWCLVFHIIGKKKWKEKHEAKHIILGEFPDWLVDFEDDLLLDFFEIATKRYKKDYSPVSLIPAKKISEYGYYQPNYNPSRTCALIHYKPTV